MAPRTLYAFSLLPVLSIALLLGLTALLRGRGPARGLAVYCFTVALWSGSLTLAALPTPSGTVELGRGLPPRRLRPRAAASHGARGVGLPRRGRHPDGRRAAARRALRSGHAARRSRLLAGDGARHHGRDGAAVAAGPRLRRRRRGRAP